MGTEVPQQRFTFDVGGDEPTEALLRMSGAMFTHRELRKGEEIHCQVVDADGVVVADGYGRVVGIAFKDSLDEHGHVTRTERIHSARMS